MKITLLLVGKTSLAYLNEGIDEYIKRIGRYVTFELRIINDVRNARNLTPDVLKQMEGELILEALKQHDEVVLLDENGSRYTSVEFARWIERKQNAGTKWLAFVVGGAYGFSDEVYNRATAKISLSPMTFSHQLVRLVFAEQLYRAYSIINKLPYHHA